MKKFLLKIAAWCYMIISFITLMLAIALSFTFRGQLQQQIWVYGVVYLASAVVIITQEKCSIWWNKIVRL